MANTFSRTTIDALYAALGGFAEPEAHPRDVWKERLRKLYARPEMNADRVAEILETTPNNVRVHASLMQLPHRRSGPTL
jgi:hypothetical protein